VTSGYIFFGLLVVLLLELLLGLSQELGHRAARGLLRLRQRSYLAQSSVQLYREVRLSLGQAYQKSVAFLA
jgi:hypothetical protein